MKLLLKIISILAVVSVIAISLVLYFIYTSVGGTLQASHAEIQSLNTKQSLDIIDRILYERYLDIQLIAGSVPLKKLLIGQPVASSDVRQRMDEFLLLTGPWYDLDVINNDGVVVYSADNEELGENISDYPADYLAFTQAQSGRVYYSDLLKAENTQKPTIIFATPIIDKNKIAGVVLGRFAWPVILDFLSTSGFDRIYLYNKDKALIGSGNRADLVNILKQKQPVSLNGITPDNSLIIKEPINNDSVEFLASVAYSDGYLNYLGNGWQLVIETPTEKIFSAVNKVITFQLIIILIIAILTALSFLLFIFYFIVRPILTLTRVAEAIAHGDLTKRAPVVSNDELGILTGTFNNMIDELRGVYGKLEQRVAEKTKGLSEALVKLKKNNESLSATQKSVLNVLEDVEEEKRVSEALAKDLEKFRLAVAEASDHIVITDKEGIVIFANKGVKNITGFSNSEVVGKKVGTDKLWGGLMDKKFYEKMWHTIKVDKKPFAGEINNKRKNGELYTAFASITPILDKNGEVEFFVALERDITKEKQIDKAKTEFVSLASHQLRTPLSAINWYAEMLLAGDAGKLNAEQDKYIKEIYSGNQRMVALVNALLNVSRIELGTFAVEPQPTDFSVVAKSVIGELQPQIKKKKLNFNFNYDKSLPLIEADPKLVRILIQNLLTNAIKYTPNSGKISVSLIKKDGSVEISVADTGYGIPEAAKKKIFEKLYRADNIREKETEGTGLGLYIVKNIVDQAKGKIWFESEENKGSNFHIILPFKGMKKKTGSKELTPN